MRREWLCGLMASLLIGPASAQPAPRVPQPPAQPAAPAPDPAMEAAQKAYDALSENERRAIQNALMWTGDYNAVVGVNFGRRLYDAIRSFQRKRNSPPSGILSAADERALIQEGERIRTSVRFATLDDATTKIRLGVPLRVTEKRRPVNGSGFVGTSYNSNDNALALELASWSLSAKTLEQSFAEETANKPGRRITYRFQRPDFFVVSGEEGGRTYYTRAAKNADQMRVFTFTYPTARKGDFERVMLAVANSFDPFPGTTVASTNPTASNPTAQTPPPRPVFAATGLVIDGKVMTSAEATKACANLTVNGGAATVQPGPQGSGVILLTMSGGGAAPRSVIVGVNRARGNDDAVVALSAIPNERQPQVASGAMRAAGDTALLVAGLPGGAMGAPVFDRTGLLVGVVADNPKPIAVASLGAVPAVNHRLIPAAQLAALFPSAAAAQNLSAGAIATRIAPSIVAIGCGS